jgi:hypothetical protein
MRVAAAQLGYAGLGAMHLAGFGLGVTDTDVLKAGTVITFGVHGTPCSGIYEQDIKNDLNNWAGSMMQINSVTTTAEGYVPLVVDVIVNATVKNDITAGSLRGQIIAALAALSNSSFWSTCAGGVSLKDGTLSVASGGTSNAATCPAGTQANAQGVCVPPDTGIDFTKIALYAGLGLAGLVIVLLVVKK